MIKTKIFTKISELNEWIEKETENTPYFRVKNIQYRVAAAQHMIHDRIFVIYEERTEKEEDELIKAFSEALFGKEKEND